MSENFLQLTPHSPIIARDGRPFGVGQGNRMRGLPWPLPSVVAGSLRTALVKEDLGLNFSGDMPQRLMAVEVAGVFPAVGRHLYLPVPSDAVAEPTADGERIKTVHRATPQPNVGGCDFPNDLPLRPVMLSEEQAAMDFKPGDMPTWWPAEQLNEWLVGNSFAFDKTFLNDPLHETRDHVCLDAERGAAAEGQIFATAGLNVTHLPRYYPKDLPSEQPAKSFADRFAEVSLAARVTIHESGFEHVDALNAWHPLGGERRLVHWQSSDSASLWTCPDVVKHTLGNATRIRMVLATPAVFAGGWKPEWLNDKLEGNPPGTKGKLKLVGVSNGRWRAVSGWSLAPPRGPKPIRRMVPAGSVYFFNIVDGDPSTLADHWLKSVSDGEQERRDGFGLAVWGTW